MWTRRRFLEATALGAAGLALRGRLAADEEKPVRPNIIFIMADDLGWGELGCYGSRKIRTPAIDRIAAEGMKFGAAYCGTSVCAPSRCSLMTGLHMGHAAVRANREIQPEGQMPLPEGTLTVGHVLQRAGYKTACIGKWGLGYPGSRSEPNQMGFDYFYGYNCQRQAHSYYPKHLWRNGRKEELDGKTYSHDLMAADALDWVRGNCGSPFFLYFALTIPHAQYQVPDLGPYEKEDWPEVEKTIAAMITRMDRDVGRLLDLLKELKIDDRTLVVFTSDNGAMDAYKGHTLEFFNSNGPWRSYKRSMYEGGLRVPAVARWPGRVRPGSQCDEPWAFWDLLPTAAELAGTKLPEGLRTDGLSIVPLLLGRPMPRREYLYWELHEGRFQQAIRMGDWKGVRTGPGRPLELYDLKADGGERNDLAADRPDVVARLEAAMKAARTDSPLWPTDLGGGKGKAAPKKPAGKAATKG